MADSIGVRREGRGRDRQVSLRKPRLDSARPPPLIPILLMSLADNILIFQDWTVTVVEDPMKNAFVLPSGNIFVFTGMLEVIIIYFT